MHQQMLHQHMLQQQLFAAAQQGAQAGEAPQNGGRETTYRNKARRKATEKPTVRRRPPARGRCAGRAARAAAC